MLLFQPCVAFACAANILLLLLCEPSFKQVAEPVQNVLVLWVADRGLCPLVHLASKCECVGFYLLDFPLVLVVAVCHEELVAFLAERAALEWQYALLGLIRSRITTV